MKKLLMLAGVLMFAFALPGLAQADGGPSIASATPVVVGQQQFGNTATGAQSQGGCFDSVGKKYRSWWAFTVASGDAITVDWEAQNPRDTALNLFQVGTTDYTFTTSDPVANSSLNDNGKAELTYRATQSGSIPLEFVTDEGCFGQVGPYDFVVYIRHALRVFLPKVYQLARSGTVSVRVANPDGAPISDSTLSVALQIKKRSRAKYQTIGKATVTNGVARVRYTVPPGLRHEQINLRAVGTGNSYVTQTSASQQSKTK